MFSMDGATGLQHGVRTLPVLSHFAFQFRPLVWHWPCFPIEDTHAGGVVVLSVARIPTPS